MRCWAKVTIGVPSPDKDKAEGAIIPLSAGSSRNNSLKTLKSREKGCLSEGATFSRCRIRASTVVFSMGEAFAPLSLASSPYALAVVPSEVYRWTKATRDGNRSPQRCRHRGNPKFETAQYAIRWYELHLFCPFGIGRNPSLRQWTTVWSAAYRTASLELGQIESSNPA